MMERRSVVDHAGTVDHRTSFCNTTQVAAKVYSRPTATNKQSAGSAGKARVKVGTSVTYHLPVDNVTPNRKGIVNHRRTSEAFGRRIRKTDPATPANSSKPLTSSSNGRP